MSPLSRGLATSLDPKSTYHFYCPGAPSVAVQCNRVPSSRVVAASRRLIGMMETEGYVSLRDCAVPLPSSITLLPTHSTAEGHTDT